MFGSELLMLGEMFLFAAVVTILGGAVGYLLVLVVDVINSASSRALTPFLRLGQWAPFFIVCALPKWPIQGIPLELIAGVATVSAFVLYELLIGRTSAWHLRVSELPKLARGAALYALLFSIYSQIFQSSGWMAEMSHRPGATYGFVLTTCLIIFLFERAFGANFDDSAKQHGDASISFLEDLKPAYAVVAVILSVVGLGTWQIFAKFGERNLMLGSPVEVAVVGFSTLFQGSNNTAVLIGRAWSIEDALISTLEILIGVIVAGGLSLIIYNMMIKHDSFRRVMSQLLITTYLAPLIGVLGFSHWVGRDWEFWLTILVVASVTFYPFLKSMWGCASTPIQLRILIASVESLPFAFVGMMIGESWAASKGIAFFTILSRSARRINEAMAVSLLSFTLFVVFSVFLWVISKSLLSRPNRFRTLDK